jgi:DNA-directed RNA polymerase sigma subunit (sigma70/sigma32)
MMIATSVVSYDEALTLEIGHLTGLSPVVVEQDVHQDEHNDQIDVLRYYLREINRYPLLSEAEERLLVARIALGDHEARTRLIESHLRLVVTIATCYQGHVQDCQHMSLPDLIQYGNLGLISAVDQYNLSCGASFLLCAIRAIQAAIQDALIYEDASGHLRAFFSHLQAS